MMKHFLQGVILNTRILFSLILTLKLILLFIKIQFVNKGILFINLPSIFKDNYPISSIPTYVEDRESPIICYKYNKPIRSTVLNYNKFVTELYIESTISDSIDCKDSKYCYQPAGHIVTGDLKIITGSRIWSMSYVKDQLI